MADELTPTVTTSTAAKTDVEVVVAEETVVTTQRPTTAMDRTDIEDTTTISTIPVASISTNHQTQDDDALMAQKLYAIEQLTYVYGFSYDVAVQAVEYIVDSNETINNTTTTSNSSKIDITACYNYILDSGLGNDSGGPIIPKSNCVHITAIMKKNRMISINQLPIQPALAPCSYQLDDKSSIATAIGTTNNKPQIGRLKSDTMYDDHIDHNNFTTTTTNTTKCPGNENWLCLLCGVVRCSRYCYGHAVQHWEDTQQAKKAKSDIVGNDSNDTDMDIDEYGHCMMISLSDLSVWCHCCQSYISTNIGSTGTCIQPYIQQLEYYKFPVSDVPLLPVDNKGQCNDDQTPTNAIESSMGDHISASTTSRIESPKVTKRVKGNDHHQQEQRIYTTIDDNVKNDEMLSFDLPVEPAVVNMDHEKSTEETAIENDEKDKTEESDENEEEDDDVEADPGNQMEGSDDDNYDTNEDVELNLMMQLRVISEQQGIPIEYLLQQARRMINNNTDDEDDVSVEYPFDTFPTSIDDVAKFILSDKCQRILILAGAGMSVASGIPDFRSADGLYATLNPNLLTADAKERAEIKMDPTIALDQHLFLQNPLPMLELQREFILGTRDKRWKATLAHRFVELLHTKTNKLVRHYTQNIDGLEDQCTQLPSKKVIAVHGSMDRAECARCHTESDFLDFCKKVQDQIKDLSGNDTLAPHNSTPIECKTCGFTAMKPAIVLFRSSLPKAFAQNVPNDVSDIDLLIVIGTSLRVAPANSIVRQVPKSAMRVLVNREEAGGHLGMIFDDDEPSRNYFAQGECDAVFLELMDSLGWLEDLEYLIPNNLLPESSAMLLKEYLEKRRRPGEVIQA